MDLLNVSSTLDGFFWSKIMIYGCLLAGIYFSLLMKFPQVRLIKDMLKQLFKAEESKEGISSFQALSMSLGGRVGTGNITGVASAIFFGGPGAVFWMWAIAFLGASSAYIESALAQVWKESVKGEYFGGPAYYMEKGLGLRWLGICFAILTIIGCGISLPGIQSNAFTQAFSHSFSIQPWLIGIFYTALVAWVVLGGGRRIAKTCSAIVPFMCLAYIIISVIVLLVNFTKIYDVFVLIFSSAFSLNAIYGAIIGKAIEWGVKRGVFSNEAGQGTGAQAAGSAEVSHPAKQGLVQAFSVYIDTLLVCTATAVMILSTNAYNVLNPDGSGGFITQYMEGLEQSNFTQVAVESVVTGFGGPFIAIALLFFTFSTILAYAFYTDSSLRFIFKNNPNSPWFNRSMILGRVIICISTLTGTILSVGVVWNFGSAAVGAMAWFNIIVIILLTKTGLATLRDYESQKKMGLDPVFIPSRCGIKHAELWDDIAKEHYSQQYQALVDKTK